IPPPRPQHSQEARERTTTRLARSIASFRANGFDVVSVNRAAEIPALRQAFGGIGFVEATRQGLFGDRYGPSFGPVFDACRQRPLCAVLNADVYLVRSRIGDALARNPRRFYVARRADIVDYGAAYVGTYTRGIDAFFFSPEHCPALIGDPDVAKLQL